MSDPVAADADSQDAAMGAHDMQRMLEVRDTLPAVTLDNVARCQSGTLGVWYSLQRDLAGLAMQGTLDFVHQRSTSMNSAVINALNEVERHEGTDRDCLTPIWAGTGYLPWCATSAN